MGLNIKKGRSPGSFFVADVALERVQLESMLAVPDQEQEQSNTSQLSRTCEVNL